MTIASMKADKVQLENQGSDPAGTEGDMIYNSADKKLKFYNGTAWIDTGGINNTAKYDAFSDYTVDDSLNATYWDVTLGTSWTATIQSNAQPHGGGAQNVLRVQGSASGNVGSYSASIFTKLLAANKSKFVRFYSEMSTGQYAQNYTTFNCSIGNATDGWTSITPFNVPSSCAGGTNAKFMVAVIAQGANEYLIFGDTTSLLTLANGCQIKFDCVVNSTDTPDRQAAQTDYIGDIWEEQ